MDDRWAYRRSYADGVWLGPGAARAEELLAGADVVLNIAGATNLDDERLKVGRPVYFSTDPVLPEVAVANGDPRTRAAIRAHECVISFGENIGTPHSLLPPLPKLRARTRQPVLLDLWQAGPPPRREFTTVGNWRQEGLDLTFRGETYRWSKHHEFRKFLDLPLRIARPLELAMTLGERTQVCLEDREDVPSLGASAADRELLESHGWRITPADFTTDPWRYRDYVRDSAGEFTVARDLNVRTRSGWFSERSACYLAAGRPVVTQDTGFGTVLPTGGGLFAFNTMDDILAAFDAIESDYARHSRAARAVAEEYFRAETVLAKLLADLGL
jgi:hypothetical protein